MPLNYFWHSWPGSVCTQHLIGEENENRNEFLILSLSPRSPPLCLREWLTHFTAGVPGKQSSFHSKCV